jgi:hypothetical protein
MKYGVFLCEGGRSLWSVEDKATLVSVKKLLKENDFPLLNLTKIDGILYAEIDSTKINLDNFYLWSDLPLGSDQDVWRILDIPTALWSCPVFKDHFFKESNLAECALKPLLSV